MLAREIVARPERRRQNNIAAGFPVESVDISGRMAVPEPVAGRRRIRLLIPAGDYPFSIVNWAAQRLPFI